MKAEWGDGLRHHHLMARRELTYWLSDKEWAKILKGEIIMVPFHPMWMPSGELWAFIGKDPKESDPRAQAIMAEGGSCCRYPITEAVRLNLEAKGATTATYGPFNLTVLLERTAKEIEAEPTASKAASDQEGA